MAVRREWVELEYAINISTHQLNLHTGKAAAKLVVKAGGTAWIVGRSIEKLESARAEISEDKSLVNITSLDWYLSHKL